MADNKSIRQPHDKKRIDVHDPQEVRNWCKALGVSELILKAAVSAVGTSAEAVKKYIAKLT